MANQMLTEEQVYEKCEPFTSLRQQFEHLRSPHNLIIKVRPDVFQNYATFKHLTDAEHALVLTHPILSKLFTKLYHFHNLGTMDEQTFTLAQHYFRFKNIILKKD